LNVSDVMLTDVQVIGLETSVADAAQLMREANTGCLVIMEGGSLAGIITERDMVLGCLVDGHISWNCKVYRHMTILTEGAYPNMSIGDAAITMLDKEVNFLPVVEDGNVLGLVFVEDSYRAIERDNEPQPVLI
jgi:CBS domain-containing protein